jgi:hypothetical protein
VRLGRSPNSQFHCRRAEWNPRVRSGAIDTSDCSRWTHGEKLSPFRQVRERTMNRHDHAAETREDPTEGLDPFELGSVLEETRGGMGFNTEFGIPHP